MSYPPPGLVGFLMPNFGNFGQATGFVGQAYTDAIEALKNIMDSSPTGTEEWKTEWFAFWADIGVLLCAACCGTCLGNRTVAAVSGRPCEAECLTACLTCCCQTCYSVSLRTKLRAKFNIKGTRQMDFFLVWCCGSCTGCQHAREVQARDSKYIIPMSSSGGGAPGGEAMSD